MFFFFDFSLPHVLTVTGDGGSDILTRGDYITVSGCECVLDFDCDDADPCTVDACDPATGICSYILLAAMDDVYATDEQTPLAVPAPGVLANDLSGNLSVNFSGSIGITATLATTTAHGTLILNSNGSFVYTPVEG